MGQYEIRKVDDPFGNKHSHTLLAACAL